MRRLFSGLTRQLATIAFSLGFATAVEVAVDPSGAQQQLNEELLATLRAGMQSEMHELRKGQGSLLQQQQQILELLRATAAAAARRPLLSDAEQERQRRVRQHTRDVVAMVRLAHRRSRLFLFLEDDWRLCPLSLLALQHVASKASRYDPAWLSVRVSFGLAGVLVHNDNLDLPTLADHLEAHQLSHPPDHLATLFMLGVRAEARLEPRPGRPAPDPTRCSHARAPRRMAAAQAAPEHLPAPMLPVSTDDGLPLHAELRLGGAWRGRRRHFSFRYNLLEHVGRVSTLRDEPHSDALPKCNDFLGVPALFLEECFHLGHCPDDDLWPCDSPNATRAPSLPRLVSNWPALCGFHSMLR
eukprot:Transcript_27499.p1 GENE.Transcript_27499~~Transcript_27499.p1  ORF type:complete len:356 (+),score=113.09 Transcript_27499:1134-2201(+)